MLRYVREELRAKSKHSNTCTRDELRQKQLPQPTEIDDSNDVQGTIDSMILVSLGIRFGDGEQGEHRVVGALARRAPG